MATYIEYTLEDGTKMLVEVVNKDEGNAIPAASRGGIQVVEASAKLEESFPSINNTFKSILNEFDKLHIYEAEIKFGMSVVGEAGVVAIGKVGGEVNFEVAMKWRKS